MLDEVADAFKTMKFVLNVLKRPALSPVEPFQTLFDLGILPFLGKHSERGTDPRVVEYDCEPPHEKPR